MRQMPVDMTARWVETLCVLTTSLLMLTAVQPQPAPMIFRRYDPQMILSVNCKCLLYNDCRNDFEILYSMLCTVINNLIILSSIHTDLCVPQHSLSRVKVLQEIISDFLILVI